MLWDGGYVPMSSGIIVFGLFTYAVAQAMLTPGGADETVLYSIKRHRSPNQLPFLSCVRAA